MHFKTVTAYSFENTDAFVKHAPSSRAPRAIFRMDGSKLLAPSSPLWLNDEQNTERTRAAPQGLRVHARRRRAAQGPLCCQGSETVLPGRGLHSPPRRLGRGPEG